jgi:hypothetical protein
MSVQLRKVLPSLVSRESDTKLVEKIHYLLHIQRDHFNKFPLLPIAADMRTFALGK